MEGHNRDGIVVALDAPPGVGTPEPPMQLNADRSHPMTAVTSHETTRVSAAEIPLPASEAARYLGLSVKTLANWRLAGRGPSYISYGGRIVYLLDDLESFRQMHRTRTSSAA